MYQNDAVECNTHKQDTHTLMYDMQKEEGPVTFFMRESWRRHIHRMQYIQWIMALVTANARYNNFQNLRLNMANNFNVAS